jgi:hypothetical protein
MVMMLTGAKGQSCSMQGADTESGGTARGSGTSRVTPDVSGAWDLTYEDDLDVTINIGGTVYSDTVGSAGGIITIDHDGQPLSFDLDCDRPAVVCPSEVWAAQVTMEQPDALFPRNVNVTIPSFECDGELIDPVPSECGVGTENEECAPICDGSINVQSEDVFGRITLDNERLRVLLGADIYAGFTCALLGVSIATANLQTTGSSGAEDWTAVELTEGKITTGFGAGCLWIADPNDDGTSEGVIIGGTIKLTTHFRGARQQGEP